MKITYLGTAAAEGMPAVFCNCPSCRKARQSKGKDIRTRSQVLVNGDLLIDFPMDTYAHSIFYGFDLSAVHTVLITHAHMDHCYPLELVLHGAPYAHNMTEQTLSVFGSSTVMELINEQSRFEMRDSVLASLNLNPITPFQTFTSRGYKVIPLPAHHTKSEDCFVYLVSKDNKTVMHFCDSGILDDSIYKYLKDNKIMIDLVSFDCTYGFMRKGEGRHMGALDNADEREKMIAHGIVNKNTKYVLTHFSHNGGLLHDELLQKAKGMNFIVAHDNMSIEF